MQRKSPTALKTGSFIGIAAPATCLEPDLLFKGAKKLASLGYNVHFNDQLLKIHRSFAGSDSSRAAVLEELLKNPLIEAIWCARGGYGVTRILSELDRRKAPALLKKHPKVLMGYSDITALHVYFYLRAGIKTLHSPLIATPKWLKLGKKELALHQKILSGKMDLGKKSHSTKWPTHWLEGSSKKSISGILLGGNLSLLATLAGTPWQPNFKNCILFIEDCGEAPYRLDRMLTQLRNAGMLNGVKAVVAGDLTADVVNPPSKNAWQEVLKDQFIARKIPVLFNLPVGHGKRNEPLPLGIRARISKSGKLEFLEQVCAER